MYKGNSETGVLVCGKIESPKTLSIITNIKRKKKLYVASFINLFIDYRESLACKHNAPIRGF